MALGGEAGHLRIREHFDEPQFCHNMCLRGVQSFGRGEDTRPDLRCGARRRSKILHCAHGTQNQMHRLTQEGMNFRAKYTRCVQNQIEKHE